MISSSPGIILCSLALKSPGNSVGILSVLLLNVLSRSSSNLCVLFSSEWACGAYALIIYRYGLVLSLSLLMFDDIGSRSSISVFHVLLIISPTPAVSVFVPLCCPFPFFPVPCPVPVHSCVCSCYSYDSHDYDDYSSSPYDYYDYQYVCCSYYY